MSRRTGAVVVAALSASLLALELAWTRLFSAEFFYSFAFLILSLAILGLGLGALALRLVPALDRPGTVPVMLGAAGLATLVAPLLALRLGLDFARLTTEPGMVARLLGAVGLLASAYFPGGVALALVFRRGHDRMPVLYMADLVGAAAGVALVIAGMQALGTPAATVLCSLPLFAASALAAPGRWRLVPALLGLASLALVPRAPDLLRTDRPERAPVIYEHWDAMAKVKVYAYGDDHQGINIDNVANSPVLRFDGNFADPTLADTPWGIDAGWLIQRFGGRCRFLSLGAGGGGDVLQALAEGAAVVHAVEVNPHLNRMMLQGDPAGYLASPRLPPAAGGGEPAVPRYRTPDGAPITTAEFSGHLYRDPRVRVVSEDGRAYVRRHPGEFDLIYSLSSNTWAALGSGSFAFAESYLFTREAFADYWRALSDEGFLSMEHQVYMPRLAAAALEALRAEGVADPAAHLAVYELPRLRRHLLLLSKRPLTDEVRQHAFGDLASADPTALRLLWPAPSGAEPTLIARIVAEGWAAVARDAPVQVSPATDDRPFVAQMGRWRNFDLAKLGARAEVSEFQGWPLSQSILVVVLLVVTVVVLPLNLLPFLRRERLAPRQWLYFFLIGLGFMFVEVVLMQKYALFIGASVWSIATVLLALLASSGVGSRLSPFVQARWVFPGIALLVLAHAFLGGPLTGHLAELPQWARIATTALLVMPLGLLMGMPFPKGAVQAGALVDWGFAVNGAASVFGGTAVVLVAFAWGFTAALVIAAAVYLGAWRAYAAR